MTDRPNSELQHHTGSCQGEKGHDDGSRRVEMPDEMSFYGYTESELLAKYPQLLKMPWKSRIRKMVRLAWTDRELEMYSKYLDERASQITTPL